MPALCMARIVSRYASWSYPCTQRNGGDMVPACVLEHFIGLAYDSPCASAMILEGADALQLWQEQHTPLTG